MPKVVENRLSALAVKRLAANGFYLDGRGLYLRIEDGRRHWVLRATRPGSGKSSWFNIGPARDISLSEARERARAMRLKIRDGGNPTAERRAIRDAAKVAPERTFQAVAEAYIAAHRAGWRSAKHAEQGRQSLAAYAYPEFGTKGVADITVQDVLAVISGLWTEKTETASRVRSRIGLVLDFAKAQGWRSGENPAAWRGNLDHLLPKRSKVARVKHFAAAPYADMPAVMARLDAVGSVSARCLAFAILTAARSSEARGATWAEIDLNARTWTVPGERMKAGRPHRVPLNNGAIRILETTKPLQRAPGSLVFPGGRATKPLSDVAVSQAMARAAGGGATVHGCRSSFRDWCAERTAYPSEVAEAALAHTSRDRVEAAYARSDLFDLRARLMADWAAFLSAPAIAADVVVPIGAARVVG